LKAAGIEPGDEVLVPANSFFVTAEAVSNVGAKPVFSDVNPSTFHLDIASAERMLTSQTRAIIPVHLYGRAMDLRQVAEFAAAHTGCRSSKMLPRRMGACATALRLAPQAGLHASVSILAKTWVPMEMQAL